MATIAEPLLVPEYELRATDVVFVSQTRWDAAEDDDNLRGSPELVIEVLSPSNTKGNARKSCAMSFHWNRRIWVVDHKRRQVTVTRRQNGNLVYESEQIIPRPLFDSALAVAIIFA